MSDGNVEKAILAAMLKPTSQLLERVTLHNQILVHNFKHAVERACECRLIGCAQTFPITLIPNQALYPKYCQDHRTEFRRKEFLRRFTERPGTASLQVQGFRVLTDPTQTPSILR